MPSGAGPTKCSNCGLPLSTPFVSVVLRGDGTEYTLRNALPDEDIDGEGCVVVCRHEKCSDRERAKFHGNGRIKREPAPPIVHHDGIQFTAGGKFVIKRRGSRIMALLPNFGNRYDYRPEDRYRRGRRAEPGSG